MGLRRKNINNLSANEKIKIKNNIILRTIKKSKQKL